ncbi:MAG: zinc ribbon domain-containing protein, partial [Lachnospiraceae bacterium]|nr:zinc ribbon domain-containing protein [Lachnospiraceae bacterium]
MNIIWGAFVSLIFFSAILIVPILIGVYVYRDATRRGMNALVWTLIALFAPSLIGFIIYLLVRSSYSDLECPRCQTTIKDEYVLCPKCGAKLRPFCPNCSAPVEPDWTVCPRCATPLEEISRDVVVPVQKKDKSLSKILLAVILIPVVLI